MSDGVIIIQIMFITIGMIILGMILNYILGLRKQALSEMRKKALNIQERIRNAQLTGDYQLLAQTQQESVQYMKQMMKKQLVPMCFRCIIFLGIFAILGFVYADYGSGLLPFPILFFGDGWIAIYILFSLGFSLLIYGVKKLYKKITGKGTKTQSYLKEIMGMVSPTQQDNRLPFQMSSNIQTRLDYSGDITPESKSEDLSSKKDSWKKRIED